ncbi:S-adenosylmethionine sensor upstream of mTORC1 [Frankliniella fusca]|uniref:S-adenosylmethionine sensor upstream of mTORC1 n=1 Tax=Frankliniella fusca TaxID=407009 RepID=A0AAE1HWT2_9NEOP|nr:S-adenosylmethionine sensor upstream of mTORC1 [Frankliniella fusca]
MASENHRDLANAIKNVHQTLRQEAKKIGEEDAWREHCEKREVLKSYSQAMRKLATEHWDKNSADEQNKKAISRVKWIVEQCEDYFFTGKKLKAFQKEQALCLKYDLNIDILAEHEGISCKASDVVTVLDVGSCYNPFKNFPRFNVVAVDIAPASSDVHECDFLNVELREGECNPFNSDGKITSLKAASYDVVIFSLLLEYFPTSKQRYICCSKASKLLVPGGILCIVTPDSKHATANAGIMKKWRYALASEGLLRIEYDKLPHLHCMVFRKCIHSSLSRQWLSSMILSDTKNGKSVSGSPEQLMVIPQDYHSYAEEEDGFYVPEVRDSDESIATIFADLPTL